MKPFEWSDWVRLGRLLIRDARQNWDSLLSKGFSEKGPGDFVGHLDYTRQELITDFIRQRESEVLIYGEEDEQDHENIAEDCFVVDPIDGTANSAIGDICGTMVAQIANRTVVGAFIVYYNGPRSPKDEEQMIFATAQGVYCGKAGTPFVRRSGTAHEQIVRAGGIISISQSAWPTNILPMYRLIDTARRHKVILRFAGVGASCGDALRLLQGRTHAVLYMGSHFWDVAAPAFIAEKVPGLSATLHDGSPIPTAYWTTRDNHKLILASSTEVAEKLAPILADYWQKE